MDADMSLFRHPYRTNVYQEAVELGESKMEEKSKIDAFIKHFGKSFLENLPLYECGILVRRNNPACVKFNEEWWRLINKWSVRDQITCPIAIASSGIKVNVIKFNLRQHRLFRYESHHAPPVI